MADCVTVCTYMLSRHPRRHAMCGCTAAGTCRCAVPQLHLQCAMESIRSRTFDFETVRGQSSGDLWLSLLLELTLLNAVDQCVRWRPVKL